MPGGFTPPEQIKWDGVPMKQRFMGRQVRMPISELKARLAEKLAY